jgi:hypothetical protein
MMRKKIFCTGPTGTAKAGQKISCNSTTSPTNEPTKEGPLSFVLLETPIASVSTVSRGHPSLISLMLAHEKLAGVINTRIKGTHEGGWGGLTEKYMLFIY